MTLDEFFHAHPRAALALSGGVDSCCLLSLALRHGCQVRPYFVKSAFQPAFELADAQALCRELGVGLTVLHLDVLSAPEVAANPADRCYHCKHQIFSAILAQAKADGFSTVFDGTNASDNAGDRPGMRALREMEVLSPLRLCGLTKAQVRAEAKAAGLPVWDKPAYACLATRVPTGEALTAELLERVERAEDALFALGFSDFRVRVFHDAARLQLPKGQFLQAAERSEEIREALRPWFTYVFLDLDKR